jgi:dGTPase
LAEVPFFGALLAGIRTEYPELAAERVQAALVRRTLKTMVEDVVAESRRRLVALDPVTADDVRGAVRTTIAFSTEMMESDRAIKARLKRDVYRHPDVTAVMKKAETVVRDLFRRYHEDPVALPEAWRQPGGSDGARVAADFIAGMTDRYALLEHQRFFGGAADLR